MKPIKAVFKNGFISPEIFLKPLIKKYRRHPVYIFSDIWQLLTARPE